MSSNEEVPEESNEEVPEEIERLRKESLLTSEEVTEEIEWARRFVPSVDIGTQRGLMDILTEAISQYTYSTKPEAKKRILFYTDAIRISHGLQPYKQGNEPLVRRFLKEIGHS